MKHALRNLVSLALACTLAQGLVAAPALSFAPASVAIVRGQIVTIDLRISGLEETSVWGYSVYLSYDPSVVQVVGGNFGGSDVSNQVACPGSTVVTCYHMGSAIETNWWQPQGTVYFAEHVNTFHWNSNIDLDALQLDAFSLVHLEFMGIAEGSSWLEASGSFLSHPWMAQGFSVPNVSTQIDVALAEPTSAWLSLSGLLTLLGVGLRSRAGAYLRRARGCAAS